MKILFLQGFGISIKVVEGKVRITNGKSLFNNRGKEHEIIEVSGTPNFDKIVIEGTSGWISLEALKTLSDFDVNGRVNFDENKMCRIKGLHLGN